VTRFPQSGNSKLEEVNRIMIGHLSRWSILFEFS